MPTHGVFATSAATFRDLRSRPGIRLAGLAIAVLLLLLPQICSRAVDEYAALGMQVGISTIAVLLALVAGFAGLRSGAADGDLAATSEWRTTPLTPGAYVAGRLAGIATLTIVAFLALTPFLIAGQFDALHLDAPDPLVAAFAAIGIVLSAALFGAIGMFLAAAMSAQLATILFLVTVVATRTLVPSLVARGGASGWIAALLPDPSRLDLSRELAFHRPVDPASMLLACAACALQIAAFLVAAAWSLRRRET